jgi:hypothetical protein
MSTELVVENKDSFTDHVKRWVLLDTQLKMIHEKTKALRESKHTSAAIICEYMQNHDLKNKKIEIHDGDLKIYDKKEYSPLTYSYIEQCLDKIISNKSQVEYIIKYLKDNREITTVPDIRRTYASAKI